MKKKLPLSRHSLLEGLCSEKIVDKGALAGTLSKNIRAEMSASSHCQI